MAFAESFETVDGCRIRLLRGGEGEPLLVLHGAGGGRDWLPFMDRLAERFEVIVPEHPGFGASDQPDWLDTVGDLAFFYLDLIAQFGLDQVHLMGESLGGWIAAELAVRNCARLATLTLVGASGIRVEGVPRGDLFMWSPEDTIRNVIHDQALAEQILARPASDELQMMQLKNRLSTAKLAWHPRLHNPHLRKWLHRISVPTLIVWGAYDKVLPPPYGEAWRALIPGSRLEVLADCGHLPQIEKADDFVALLSGFVAERAA